jgi:hypothetical protein
VVKRIFGLPNRAEVPAKVQQDGLDGTGAGVDPEK